MACWHVAAAAAALVCSIRAVCQHVSLQLVRGMALVVPYTCCLCDSIRSSHIQQLLA